MSKKTSLDWRHDCVHNFSRKANILLPVAIINEIPKYIACIFYFEDNSVEFRQRKNTKYEKITTFPHEKIFSKEKCVPLAIPGGFTDGYKTLVDMMLDGSIFNAVCFASYVTYVQHFLHIKNLYFPFDFLNTRT